MTIARRGRLKRLLVSADPQISIVLDAVMRSDDSAFSEQARLWHDVDQALESEKPDSRRFGGDTIGA